MIIISDTWRSTWVVCIVIKQQYAWGQHDWKYATLAHRRLFRISYFPVNWKSSPSSTYGKGQPFFCNARGCRGSLFQCLSQSKQAKWKASEEEMALHVYSKSKIRKTLSAYGTGRDLRKGQWRRRYCRQIWDKRGHTRKFVTALEVKDIVDQTHYIN